MKKFCPISIFFIALFGVILTSCSDFTGISNLSVSLNGSDFSQNSSSRNISITPDYEKYYVVVSVLGDYEEIQTLELTNQETRTIEFSSIPVNSNIYTRVDVYYLDVIERIIDSCHRFTGTSSKQRIRPGENQLSISLRNLKPTSYYTSMASGNTIGSDDRSYDFAFYENGKYRIIIGQGTLVSEGLWSGGLESGKTISMEECVFKKDGESITILDRPVQSIIEVTEPIEEYFDASITFTSLCGLTFALEYSL